MATNTKIVPFGPGRSARPPSLRGCPQITATTRWCPASQPLKASPSQEHRGGLDTTLINLTVSGNEGLEVVDRAIDPAIIALILRLAPAVRASLDALPGHRADCGYASSAWQRQLETRGVEVRLEGGVGEDGEAYTPSRQLVPRVQRGGYREGDGLVHRHWWLGVGSRGWLFDPAAHQFDDRGGVERARYVVDGVVAP
jgi:hypothetical protein